jgi:hypothetical protein
VDDALGNPVLRQVAAYRNRFAVDRGGGFRGEVTVEISDQDARAMSGEQLCCGAADAPRGSGHDCGLALQHSLHGPSLRD